MDWQTLITSLLGGGGGAAVIGYGILRKIKADIASDGASADARAIQHETIKFLRAEIKERDLLHAERMENLRREYTEFRAKAEREFGHVQKFNRETQSDLRKLARAGNLPEQELDTQIYRTGMGPLDV